MKPRALSVLVVDHDENMRLLVWTFLHEAGFAAVVASDADEGFALARILHPDVILVDSGLPGSGREALVIMLRANYSTAQIPIVLMSAFTDAQTERLHCAASLPKPFLPHELLGVIREVAAGQVHVLRDTA